VTLCHEPWKKAEPIDMTFEIWTRVGPRKHMLAGGSAPHANGQFLGEKTCPSYLRTVCTVQ